jgi:phosphoenolpyruvate carboxylase
MSTSNYYIGGVLADSEPSFRAEDLALKDDVNALGGILGEVLEALEGKALFAHVELARHAARDRRAGDAEAEARLTRILRALSPEEGLGITRAFSAYFGLVNMAERVHRIRRRRDYQREGAVQPESFVAVLATLRGAGIGPADLEALLERAQFTPVLTAHPTESTRRTLLTKEQRIAHALLARLDPQRLTPAEDAALLDSVRAELSLAWQTDEHFAQPSVADEVDHVLFFLTQVVYAALPDVYAALHAAIAEVYGPGTSVRLPQQLVRFASWVGGDMDGNPNVDAGTIRETLARHRELIVLRYHDEVTGLYEHLSQSRALVEVSTAVDHAIEAAREKVPQAWEAVPERYGDMPYRVLSALVAARLDATLRDADGGYADARELESDLEVMHAAVTGHGGTGASLIERLLVRVRTFGFHLATLDVRQDSAVHREAVGEALGRPATGATGAAPASDGALARCLATMRAVGEARVRYGAEAIGPYIVSMTEAPDDALAVLWLARLADLAAPGEPVPLDVAPLFETVDDLERAPRTMQVLLAEPLYREHVRSRGNAQVVMLGYSDSNKESGLAASRWALHEAQIAIVDTLERAPGGAVEPTLFHGRGGTISRGGGKARNGILAEPPGVVRGKLRVTEQGEIIAQKYGLEDIALRTIEMTTGALLERTAPQPPGDAEVAEWHEAARIVATRSRDAYRALVYGTPAFIDYFRAATPIDVIERMRIGSRPPARRSMAGVENLRAIPWVFAWTQSRLNLPGWYGVGTGLEALIDAIGIESVRETAQAWRFLGNLVADTEMVLAKTDIAIAAHYAELAGSAGEPMFRHLKAEFERTLQLVCTVNDAEALLDRDPVLQRNIRLRNPYVDPMSLVQVDFLQRWRDSGRADEGLLEVLMSTVRGISRGMQNTG